MQVISDPTLDISLFGPLQLHHSIHGGIKENRRKVQALLVWLLLEDNQPHSRAQLVALLWPDMSRENGLRNLRVALSRVKKHLADDDALEATRADVTLHQSPQHLIDVRRFEAFVQQIDAHNHKRLAECEPCLSQLRQAAELYRGRFLDGFSLDDSEAFEEWLFVWRERYHVMGLTQLERLAEAELSLGRLAEAETLAQRQIKLDPLQESAHRMLMRISAERGDRTQALRQFQTCTEMLMDELGVPPEEETSLLRQQIESGAYKPTPPNKSDQQPKADHKSTTATGHLPEIITPFIGREHELTLLAERLKSRDYRLISLVGPGGIGKTRLAIQAAKMAQEDFKDGVFFVPLVGLTHHQDIPAAVAEATGFSLQPDDSGPKDQIGRILVGRDILLIIDNLEHLIDGTDMLLDWLEVAPKLMILVTSRQRINAQAEDLFRLKGLPWPTDPHDPDATSYEAVRLFGDRAHRLNKSFWLNEDTIPSVVQICKQVEGLPLALELAATSIRDFNVDDIADALGQELEILSTDLRDVPSRHRQIESVFDYSWRLLTAPEQAILAQLSLFAGGFTLKAARTVTWASTITLTHLRYKSLIRAEGNGRFSMHELLRQMAEKKLNLSPEIATTAAKRHADFFIDYVISNAGALMGQHAAKMAATLKLDLDNIRSAWSSAVSRFDFDQLQRFASPLCEFYMHIGLNFELEGLIEEAQAIFERKQISPPQPLNLQLKLILLNLKAGHLPAQKFEPLFEEFLTLLKDWHSNDQRLYEAKAYYYLTDTLERGESRYSLIETAEKALQLAYAAEDRNHLGDVLCSRAHQHARHSELDQAIERLDEAIKIFESTGNIKGMAGAVYTLAPTWSENGSFWKGLIYDRRAVELYEQIGYQRKLANAHMGIALSYNLLGAFDKARWHGNQSLIHYQKLGDESDICYGYSVLAETAMMEGNYTEALDLYLKCVANRRATENYIRLRDEGIDAARTLWLAGRHNDALEIALEIVQYLAKPGLEHDLHAAHILLANIYWDLGQAEEGLGLAFDTFQKYDIRFMKTPTITSYELYKIFDQANHPNKIVVLEAVHKIIEQMAAEITEKEFLQTFLYRSFGTKELMQAFDQYKLPKIAPHFSPQQKSPSPIF